MCLRAVICLIASLLFTACAVTRDQAGAIAVRAVAHRKAPLPPGYQMSVREGQSFQEGRPTRPIWVATLRVAGRDDPLYVVDILQQDGAILSFVDYRFVQRSRAWP
jgi:hypothetical protein